MTKSKTSTVKVSQPKLSNIFPRQRLFKELDNSRKRPITWITGPAGSGKTTLAASYLDDRKLTCLWYRIDAGDDLELDIEARLLADEIVPHDGVRDAADIGILIGVGDDDHFLDARQVFQYAGDASERIEVFAAVGIPVRAEEYLGFDLPESIQCGQGSNVRSARRPHRPDTGRSQHCNRRLDQVRHVAGDPVPRADPQFA